MCIFKQSSKYTKDICDEHVGSDFTFERFKEICNLCWSEDYGFLTIDTTINYTMVDTENSLENIFNALAIKD